MKLAIASDDRDHAILVCDEAHNDIAEFFHNEHATVGQSYETALALAKQLVEGTNGVAQAPPDRRALTMIAAECHRAKWQFDIDDEEPPKAAAARVLVDLAFKTLHRIGDMALNLRNGSVVPSTKCGCLACDMGGPHASSCAVHNGTALDVGPCDCGASSASTLSRPHRGGIDAA